MSPSSLWENKPTTKGLVAIKKAPLQLGWEELLLVECLEVAQLGATFIYVISPPSNNLMRHFKDEEPQAQRG